MQNNDLSNITPPTMLIVWEGLIAICEDHGLFTRMLKKRKYDRALETFKTQPKALASMWHAMQKYDYTLSVLTYLPKTLYDGIADRLFADGVPFNNFHAYTPAEMARQLPYMPWVIGIADPEFPRARSYGSFGYFTPPNSIGVLWDGVLR